MPLIAGVVVVVLIAGAVLQGDKAEKTVGQPKHTTTAAKP